MAEILDVFGSLVGRLRSGQKSGVLKKGWVSLRADTDGDVAPEELPRISETQAITTRDAACSVDSIEAVIRGLSEAEKTRQSAMSVSAASAIASALAAQDRRDSSAVLPMTPLGAASQEWRQLWCELANGCLYAYDTRNGRCLEIVLVLQGCTIEEEEVKMPPGDVAPVGEADNADAQALLQLSRASEGPLGAEEDGSVRVLRISPIHVGESDPAFQPPTLLSFFTHKQRDEWLHAILMAAIAPPVLDAPEASPFSNRPARSSTVAHRGTMISADRTSSLPLVMEPRQGLLQYLRDPHARSELLLFMEAEMNSELLQFWMDLDHLQHTMPESLPPEVAHRMVQVLASRYVVNGAPLQVNLSSRMRDGIIDSLAAAEAGDATEALSLNIFANAQEEALSVIRSDAFPRFAKSPQGRLACLEMEARRTGGVLVEGWMYKRSGFHRTLGGAASQRRTWSHRFFVVTVSAFRYFRNEDLDEERGKLMLADMKSIVDVSGIDTMSHSNRPHSIKITTKDGKELWIAGETAYQKRELLRVLHTLQTVYTDVLASDERRRRRKEKMRLINGEAGVLLQPTSIFDEMLNRPKSKSLSAALHESHQRRGSQPEQAGSNTGALRLRSTITDNNGPGSTGARTVDQEAPSTTQLDLAGSRLYPFLLAQHIADTLNRLRNGERPTSLVVLRASAATSSLALLTRLRQSLVDEVDLIEDVLQPDASYGEPPAFRFSTLSPDDFGGGSELWFSRVCRALHTGSLAPAAALTALRGALQLLPELRTTLEEVARTEVSMHEGFRRRARRGYHKLRRKMHERSARGEKSRPSLGEALSSSNFAGEGVSSSLEWEDVLEGLEHAGGKALSTAAEKALRVDVQENVLANLLTRVEVPGSLLACNPGRGFGLKVTETNVATLARNLVAELLPPRTFGACEKCHQAVFHRDHDFPGFRIVSRGPAASQPGSPRAASRSGPRASMADAELVPRPSTLRALDWPSLALASAPSTASFSANEGAPVSWLHPECTLALDGAQILAGFELRETMADSERPSSGDEGAWRQPAEVLVGDGGREAAGLADFPGTFDRDELDARESDEGIVEDAFTPVELLCAGCSKPVALDGCIYALDRYWHPEHFNCADCNLNFAVGTKYSTAACENHLPDEEKRPLCRRDAVHPRNLLGPDANGAQDANAEMLCGVCNLFIDVDTEEELYAAMGSAVHKDCFRCVHCETQLKEVFFAVPDNYGAVAENGGVVNGADAAGAKRLHCENCTREHVAKRCHACGDAILGLNGENGEARVADGHWWHQRCFACNVCNTVLGEGVSAYFHEGKIWCDEHMRGVLREQLGALDEDDAPTCEACCEILNPGEQMVAVQGRAWHQRCFSCSTCSNAIAIGEGGTIRAAFLADGGVVCPNCVESQQSKRRAAAPRCRHCKEPILAGETLSIGEHQWHARCFVCEAADCGKAVDPGQAVALPVLPEEFGCVFCSPACAQTAYTASLLQNAA